MQRAAASVLRCSAAAGARNPSNLLCAAARSFSSAASSASSAAPSTSSATPARNPSSRRKTTLALMGAGGATAAAGAYYFSSSSSSKPSASADAPAQPPAPKFDLEEWKGFKSLDDFRLQQDIVLYQYETCPFCNKVRAYLDHAGFAYKTVEVNPLSKAEKKAAGEAVARTKAVPVVTINGKVMVESTDIMRNLERVCDFYRSKSGSAQKKTPAQEADEAAALDFVDKRIVVLTAPNLYRSFSESLHSFEYIAQNSQLRQSTGVVGRAANKYVGASVMYLLTKHKLNKKYGITDPRASLYAASREWASALPAGQSFRGGDKPNLADLACYGVIRALEPYAAGQDALNPENSGERFVKWYRDTKARVEAGKFKGDASAKQ